jgi:hypothetical protein
VPNKPPKPPLHPTTPGTPKSSKKVSISVISEAKIAEKSKEKPILSNDWKRVQLSENIEASNNEGSTNASTSMSRSGKQNQSNNISNNSDSMTQSRVSGSRT